VKTRYFVQLIALSALWGASFLFLRVASPVLGPNVLAVGRIGLATVTLALIMAALKQRWPWRHWVELTRLGALSVAVPFLLYAWAALRLPAGYSALLNSTVVVFGTLAIFLYPVLYHLIAQYRLFDLSPTAYGVFAGSTIHEVAQVVAAGRAVSEQAANTAVIAKMVRVMMLAPFLIILSAYLSRSSAKDADAIDGGDESKASPRGGIVIPWFALGFVAVAGLNSLALLPHAVVTQVIDIDTVLLAMAMAGLGLTTHVSAIRKAGIKPLALAAVLFVWLVCGGFAINAGITALLN